MANKLIRTLIRLYQLTLSPMISVGFGINCRYEESCSAYTVRKVKENGVFFGLLVGMKRFAKCSAFTCEHSSKQEQCFTKHRG